MTIVMCITLITLCISNIVLIGFMMVKFAPTKTGAPSPSPAPAPTQPEVLSEEQRKFKEEMDAFQELMNYNADVAYGITKKV